MRMENINSNPNITHPTPASLRQSSAESFGRSLKPKPVVHSNDFAHSSSFSPSLAFTGVTAKCRRPAPVANSDKLRTALSSNSRQNSRFPVIDGTYQSLFYQSHLDNACLHTAIPDQPPLLSSSSLNISGTLDKDHCSSASKSIPSSPTPSIQNTVSNSDESAYPHSEVPSPEANVPSDTSKSISFALDQPNTSSPSSSRPLQFINKSGPPAPRPRPHIPTGVYIKTHSAIQQKVRKQIREEGKIKRTSNCFIKYRTHMHPIIVARYGHQNNKEISRLAGRYWKNEPEEIKRIYRQQAAEEKERHAVLYPSYKYTPAKPTPKANGNTNSKSKTPRPWNRPIQLSPMADEPPDPSLSLSALPALHGQPTISEDDKATNAPLSSQVIKTDKPHTSSTSSFSKKKPVIEKGFVVTETALFDFKGNADLSEKRRKIRTRSDSQSDRSQCLANIIDGPASDITKEIMSSLIDVSPAENAFADTLQEPLVSTTPPSISIEGMSNLTHTFAYQPSESSVVQPVSSAVALSHTSIPSTPLDWNSMVSQLQVSGESQQLLQQWHVSQPSVHHPAVSEQFLNAVLFQKNNSSPVGDMTDQNWMQQSTTPLVANVSTDITQTQPSSANSIVIPTEPIINGHLTEPFTSPMYTPTTIANSTLRIEPGFPWQIETTFDGTPDLELLYSSESSASLSTTPVTLLTDPLTTLYLQQHTLDQLNHTSSAMSTLGEEFKSVDFEQRLTGSNVSDNLFDDTTWLIKNTSEIPSTTATWDSQLAQLSSLEIGGLSHPRFSATGSDPSSLSTSPVSISSDNVLSTWTILSEPRVINPHLYPNDSPVQENIYCDSDIDSSNDSHHRIRDSENTDGNDKNLPLASQPALAMMDLSPTWDEEEEQLKKSITYYEEIIQKKRILLSIQQQRRQQCRG
ncbi:hypothetical protein FBU30_009140 [Linnemannia zychae]|nr:hypothetical protein FBU30_009140 [Linnemannia zychae]